MNANVFLKADEHSLGMKVWPPQLRVPGALDPCKHPHFPDWLASRC